MEFQLKTPLSAFQWIKCLLNKINKLTHKLLVKWVPNEQVTLWGANSSSVHCAVQVKRDVILRASSDVLFNCWYGSRTSPTAGPSLFSTDVEIPPNCWHCLLPQLHLRTIRHWINILMILARVLVYPKSLNLKSSWNR